MSVIGIIGDMHHGIKSDSSDYHDVHIKFISWIISEFSKKNVTDVILLGDWFHNRNEINVKTLNVALENLERLASIFKVYLIIGNHDTYFKNTIDVNSLRVFKGIVNVEIIDIPKIIKLNDKNCLFVPWLINPQAFANEFIKQKTFPDFVFGHFDFIGGFLTKELKNTKFGINPNIFENTKVKVKVYSGHYHVGRRLSKYITYVGSPMELTWADTGEEKIIYILDDNMNESTIVNNISPKHIKILLSEWIKPIAIENNYIKLFIDKNVSELKIQQLQDVIKSKHPATIEIIDLVSDAEIDENKIDTAIVNDVFKLIKNYVAALTIEEGSINKEKLEKIISDVYLEAITQ